MEGTLASAREEVESAFSDANAIVAASNAEVEAWRGAVAVRDAGIAKRDERIAELDRVAAHLARRVVARERELEELRGRIDEMLVQARTYATRVRMEALRQAVAIAGKGNGNGGGRPGAVAVDEAAAREHAAAAETASEAPRSTFGVRPTAPLDLFEGLVQLEIGPLSDFSQLVGFEDAAREIAPTSEISVTRFSKGRATLDLRLAEPVDLLRELGERSPVEFKVRSLRDGRLILDLADSQVA
jgi:hypothetical protein